MDAQEQAARSFYSNTTFPDAMEAAPAAPEDVAALALFPSMREPEKAAPAGDLPEAVRELRDADSARYMHSPQTTFREALPVTEDWPEENKAVAAEFREIFQDLDLGTEQAREMVELAYSLPEVPSEQQRAEWWAEARDALRRQHGAEADEALADAKRLIERDPRLANFLRQTGLNAHPKVVALAVEKARSARMSGKLKGSR